MIEVVISIAFVVCLIALVVGCLDCLFKKKRFEALRIQESTRARQNAAFSVDIFDAASGADPVIIDIFDAASGADPVIIEPLPDILSKVSPVPVLRPKITYTERGKQEAAFSLHNVQRSFPRDHLTYLNEISTGWFGKVIDSEAVHIVGGTDRSHVIVKMLKDDASKLEQKQFMEEVLAFRCVEHVNVLSLIGQCTETTPYLVILEFATHGNLKHYLVGHRHEVDALIASNRLVHFALNAASGLACLHRHEYVHNDLAARNCLVMADYTLKIGDYGTADQLFKDEYFNAGSELLPVRWMAPETLTRVNGTWMSQNCSKISDMWSFGMLLWEICSLGERPYDILTDESVLQGVVLDRSVLPSEVKTKLPFKVKMSSLMIQCWQEPSQRLNVEQTHHILEQMSKTWTDVQHVVSDFDHKWNHLESNHGRVTITGSNTDSVSAITANHVLPSHTSPPEKPLLIKDVGIPVSASNFVIDLDSSSTSTFKNVDDISAPEISEHSSETCTDYDMSKNVSPYKIVLENELLPKVPVSADYLVPTRTSSEQTVHVHVSQGTSSTCQFFSPQSSPSSVYMTASETRTMSSIEAETVQLFSSSDINESLDSEEISLYNLTEGAIQMSTSHDEARFTNNNNVLSDTASAPHENHLSDHFCSSPAVSDDFTDFLSAVSMNGDSFLKTEIADDVYGKDASMLKLEDDSSERDMTVPIHDSMSALSTSNVFSEGDSERNDFTDFVSLTAQSSDAEIQSLPVNDLCSKVALSLDGADPSHVADSNHLAPDLSFSCPEPEVGGYHVNILNKFLDSKSDEAVFQAQKDTEASNRTDLCAEHPITTGVPEQISIEFGEFFHGRNSIPSSTELSDQSMCFNQTESSESALHKEDRQINIDQGQVNIASNTSYSFESGINNFSMTGSQTNPDTINTEENFTNYDTNNIEMDSSNHDTVRTGEDSRNCANDIALNNGIASKNNSGSADIQDYELEIEKQSLTFGSGLYRCSSINLAEDVPNASEAEENIEHPGDTDEKYLEEENNSRVDSDTESNSSGSGQEYVLSDPKVPEQPQATSAADAGSNQSLSHQTDALSTSPGEFDDYALQVASEIYLSRGLKSPRVFEIPPLETIPEHQPMAAVQEDSNYTPSDTSSMDVRYEDMFGSDSYEWDDFYGDPLIGKDISLQHKPHQPSPSPKELDLSDWSMDIDSESIASSTSLPSRQQEVLNLSVQSERLPSKSDISLDSGKSIHYFTDSELMTANHTQSFGGLRGSGVSSLLSHIQSSKVPSSTNIHQNDLYSLTDKYELESDSFSDGLASPSQAIDLVSESPSTSHISSSSLPASFHISSSPLLPPDSEVSEHYEDLVVSKSFEPSKDSNWSNTAEKPEIFKEKSKSASDSVNGEPKHDSSILKDSLNKLVSGENIEYIGQPDIVDMKLENSTFDIDLVHSVDSGASEEKSDDESGDK